MARILVIDDDRSLLRMITIMLDKAGHEPLLATHGYQGIELARSEQPDMAIVDVMMPELSGYDVCRRLREDPRTANIPLLILTARAQPMDQQMAIDSGADDFVTKPVTLDDLIYHVDQLLASGATRRPAPAPPAPTEAPAEEAIPITTALVDLPVVAVMGLRGGMGATTIAINLGLGMMQHGRSCLVDLSTSSGQVAAQLRMLPPKATWLDLANLGTRPTPHQIGAALMRHRSGVAVLAAPIKPTQARLSGDTLHHIYTVLSEGFRRTTVSLPPAFNPMSIATLKFASQVVLVVGNDPVGLETAGESLKAISELGLPGGRHVIFNHSRPDGLTREQVVKALGYSLTAEIPYEAAQMQAAAQGSPLVMSQPNSSFSQTILQIARSL
jgi:CheY-like chemotaxis protein/MinD-like ATPase involved in chromosome partitioning or flagellar assembly